MSDIRSRRFELIRRIASNKDWLSKNWHHGKVPRRECYANIEADERELAKLYSQGAGEEAVPVRSSREDERRCVTCDHVEADHTTPRRATEVPPTACMRGTGDGSCCDCPAFVAQDAPASSGAGILGELQTNAAIAVIRGILERLPDEAARQLVLEHVLRGR